MKVKWYLSTLIIILTLLGIGQQQISVPNQEIVVQFTDNEVSLSESQNTLEIVKLQLQSVGAKSIQVLKENGILRITYYSNVDIAKIKNILSKEKNLELGYTSEDQKESPIDNNTVSFNLDVFEIQNKNDFNLDFEGFVLEQKPENPRYFNPIVYISANGIDIKERKTFVEVKFTVQRNIAIAINDTSHKIPEVRAGPPA